MTLPEVLHEWAEQQDWNHIPEDKYESVNEHEYIVSDWFDGEELEMFKRFRRYINTNGEVEFYNGEPFTKVKIGGYKYWLSKSHYSSGVCLNRREY